MRRQLPLALLAALSCPALAHSPIAGIGEFYGGLLHPLLVPPHALALLVFALLLGQRGLSAMRRGLPPFLLALAVALVVASAVTLPALPSELLLLAAACAGGLLAALQRPPPATALAIAGAAIALVIGLDSGVSGLSRQQMVGTLFGCWLGAALAVILVAGLTEQFKRPWQRIAARVLGSWCAAASALVLALALRPA